jgi:hypothetical protein
MLSFKYFATMILTCLLMSACKTGRIGAEHTPDSQASPAKMSPLGTTTLRATELAAPAQALVSITTSLTATLDPRVPAGAPQPNTLYWGQTGGRPALFVRSSDSLEDPNRGLLRYLDDSSGAFENSFNFQNLSHPYAVYARELRVDLTDAKRNSVEKYMYVSLIFDQTPPCQPGGINDQPTPCPRIQEINRLIEINLTTLVSREI